MRGSLSSFPTHRSPGQTTSVCCWVPFLPPGPAPNSAFLGQAEGLIFCLRRFQCSLCSRRWASSQVQVLFHMHKSKGEPQGKVKMRVFAQRCRKCFQSPFEVPEFTTENISRILNNLVFRILKKCYREEFKSMEELPMIKEISLEGPHDSNNCEACLQGFCAQSGVGPAVQAPVSPALASISSPTFGTIIPMPSPAGSGTTVDAVNTQANKGKPLPRPSYAGPTQAASLPTHWSPRANTYRHVERRVQVTRWSEGLCSHIAPNPRCRYGNVCCFCLVLVIVVVIIVETIQWIST